MFRHTPLHPHSMKTSFIAVVQQSIPKMCKGRMLQRPVRPCSTVPAGGTDTGLSVL